MKAKRWRRRDYVYLAVAAVIVILLVAGVWINLPT